MIIKKFNREQKKKPRRSHSWCNGCDANLVNADQKCEVCGQRERPRRYKKSVDIEL